MMRSESAGPAEAVEPGLCSDHIWNLATPDIVVSYDIVGPDIIGNYDIVLKTTTS
jgi:hypothetical protein